MVLVDWEARAVRERWKGHGKSVNKVLAAPHLNGAFSASHDCLVRQWRRGDSEPVQELAGHNLSVSAITLNSAESLLFSGTILIPNSLSQHQTSLERQ